MKRLIFLSAVVMALVFASGLQAGTPQEPSNGRAPVKIMCPSRISVTEKLVQPDKGWEIDSRENSRPQRGMGYYNGDPDNGSPIMAEEGDNGYMRLLHPTDRVWVSCSYEGTTATLARPIGMINKGCHDVVVDKDKSRYGRVVGAECE